MTVCFQGDHQLHENCTRETHSSGCLCEGRPCPVAELGPYPCPPPNHLGHGVGWDLPARNLRPQESGIGVETVGSTRETIHPKYAPGPGTARRSPCPRPSYSLICRVILGKPGKAQGHEKSLGNSRSAQNWEAGDSRAGI